MSKATVAERALRLGDDEGLDAVTIRRLAQELGVTPMALYWHFKNKDELIHGMVEHAVAEIRADRDSTAPWTDQLRAMLETTIEVMRRHPALPDLLHTVVKHDADELVRATEDVLWLLHQGGFEPRVGYWVASYLLQSAIGLVSAQPGCPPTVPSHDRDEWLRQKRLSIERLSPEQFPMMVSFARTLTANQDVDEYFRFGIDLIMSGIESLSARTPA